MAKPALPAIPRWLPRLMHAAGPLTVLCALAALDHWAAQGPLPVAGLLSGMALLALLVALSWWGKSRQLKPLPSALQSALLSVTEGALGVILVFLLAAPLTVLMPQAWVAQWLRDDRATDLLVLLMLGVGLMVAARATVRFSRQTTRLALAERNAANTRAELADIERELVRAELQVLRAQVEPHFLWNTLANVEYLIRKDPAQAQTMMAHLIAYLRSSLPSGRNASSTLGSEFASVRAYLGLMSFRMGERLTFELNLEPSAEDLAFPPLLLQTLVENAIKHGLEPLPGPARLRLSALWAPDKPDFLRIEVRDNGVGLQPNPRSRGTGLGLRNVRERLQAMHAGQATLAIAGLPEGGVSATIDWPLAANPMNKTTTEAPATP